MTRPKKFTMKEIRNAQASGDTAAEVAKKVGCSEQTASRRLRQLEIQRDRGRPRLFTQKQCKGMTTAYHEPLSTFAERHKCAIPAMRRALMEGVHLLWDKRNRLTEGYEQPSNATQIRIWNVARTAPKRKRINNEAISRIAQACSCTPSEVSTYLEGCSAWNGRILDRQ